MSPRFNASNSTVFADRPQFEALTIKNQMTKCANNFLYNGTKLTSQNIRSSETQTRDLEESWTLHEYGGNPVAISQSESPMDKTSLDPSLG